MSLMDKKTIEQALRLILTIARATDNPYDNIVVEAAVTILCRIFQLEVE